jgi:hypothetical protein
LEFRALELAVRRSDQHSREVALVIEGLGKAGKEEEVFSPLLGKRRGMENIARRPAINQRLSS